MAKKINIGANLDRTNFDNQMKNLQNGNYNVNVNVNGSNNINTTANQMRQLNNQVYDTNSVFGKLRNTIANVFSSGKAYMTGYLLVLREINEACKNAKQSVEEIDSAITNLSVATGQSREETAELIKEYNQLAQDMYSTTSSVTQAADNFLRAGKSMSEAQELIQDSLMLSKLGELDSSTATEDILAVMNGMNLSVEEVNSALDAMVSLDMKAAVSSGQIAEALKYCASNADLAGISFNSVASMIGTVIDRTQQSASTVGTFFNTLLSRYKDIKISNFLTDDGDDISDYESTLKSVGVAIRDSEGEFRNYEDVLSELAEKWDSLSSVQQAAVAKVSAGTRQQNRFYSLISNYQEVLELTEVAANSAGTAIEKYNNSYVDSIEALQSKLQASFESLVIDSNLDETYKDIIKATTALVDFVNKWNLLKGVTTTIALSGAIKGFLTLKAGVTQAYVSLNQFSSALNMVNSNSAVAGNNFTRLLLLTKNLSESQTRLVLSSKSLNLVQKKQILMNQGLSEQESYLRLQNYGLATSYTGLKRATTSISNALKGLWATIRANPMVIVTAAISAATMIYSKYKQELEEAQQAQEEARQKAAELASTYEEEQASIDEQIEKYKELKEQLDKGNLSTDDARDIKEQLLEIQQSLIDSYGDEAKNLDLVNGKYETQLGLLQEISKDKAQSYVEENRDTFNKAKEELEKTRRYDVGFVTNYTSGNPETDAQKQLISYLAHYNDLVKVTEDTISGDDGSFSTTLNLEVNADVESADETLRQLSRDLEEWGKNNNIDVSGILDNISVQLQNTWTDDLEDYKTIYDEYIKADILRNDTLRPLYKESIQAVEDYNNALSNGDGIEEAKANLDTVKESFANVSNEVEGSEDIFNDIFDGVNESLEADYNLNKKFEGKYVKSFAEKLKGLTDIDLQNIRFDNDNLEEGEDTLRMLLNMTGLTTDEVQTLIDKLVELGYVQGEASNSADDLANSYTRSDMIDAINDLSDGFDKLDEIYADIKDGDTFDFSKLNTKKFKEAFEDLNLEDEYNDFIETVSQSPNDISKCQSAFDNLTTAFVNQSGVLDMVNDDTAQVCASYLKLMGVENAEEVVQAQLAKQKEETALEEEYLAATKESTAKVSEDLANATTSDINTLMEEGAITDEVAQKMIYYKIQKLLASDTVFDTSEDISNLANLIVMLEQSSIECGRLSKLINLLNNQDSVMPEERRQNIENAIQEEISNIGKNNGLEIEIPTLKYGGSTESNKTSSSSSNTKKSYDWIEKSIENIEDEISRLDKVIDSSFTSWSEKNEALEKQMDLINQEITLYEKAYDKYMEKADSIKLSEDYKELVRNGDFSISDITDKDLQEAISDYEEWYDKAKDCQDKITELTEEQLNLRVSQYENCTDELDNLRENNAITEKQYLDEMTALWKEYFENQVQLAEVAKEKKLEILNEEKEYLESVASAASNILGNRIDDIEDERDKIIESYNEQISGYEAQIDELEALKKPLQDQLDLIEEQEEREDKILALQKAQYELARAENQRSQMTFVDGQMQYTTSASDINDAREAVDDAETDLLKYNIQQQIDTYDDQIDAINDVIDGINDLIDSTNDYYDKQVDALEKIQDEWEKVIDKYDEAVDIVNFKSMFGDDSIQRLVNGDMTMVQEFAQAYTDTLSDIDTTANGVVGDITQQYSELANTDLTALGNQTKETSSLFNELNESVNKASSSISGGSSGTVSTNGNTDNANEQSTTTGNESTSLTGAIQDSYNVATETIPAETEMMDGLNESALTATDTVNTLGEAINSLPDEKTITINVEVNGNSSLLGSGYANGTANVNGTAHVEGTANVKGDWSVHQGGKSLMAEEGREIVVRNGRFFTVGDNGAEFFDLQKGDIVFNHQQTEELLKNGHISSRGKSYANGTVGNATLPDFLQPLSEDSPVYQMMEKFKNATLDMSQLVTPVNSIDKAMQSMINNVKNVSNNNSNQTGYNFNGNINVTCPGITSQEVAKQIGTELEKAFFGMSTRAYQRSKRTM
jgi:TP901 family phage tail tape measure protein